jgi:hypothetical protein
MNLHATLASLCIAASAALIPTSAATAAPLAGSLALREAAAGPLVQVQYRRYGPSRAYWRRAYRSTAFAEANQYPGYWRRGCITGDDSTTSAYPSWMVCHLRYGQWGYGGDE